MQQSLIVFLVMVTVSYFFSIRLNTEGEKMNINSKIAALVGAILSVVGIPVMMSNTPVNGFSNLANGLGEIVIGIGFLLSFFLSFFCFMVVFSKETRSKINAAKGAVLFFGGPYFLAILIVTVIWEISYISYLFLHG